jgi:hypothetical protein
LDPEANEGDPAAKVIAAAPEIPLTTSRRVKFMRSLRLKKSSAASYGHSGTEVNDSEDNPGL